MIVVVGGYSAFRRWCEDNHRDPRSYDVLWIDDYQRACALSLSRSEDIVVPLCTTHDERITYRHALSRYRRP